MTEESTTSNVPIWPHFVGHVIDTLSDGQVVPRRDIISTVVESMGLSDDALRETLDSGGSRVINRITWAITHLHRAGWIERPMRATYRVTEEGRAWRRAHPEGLEDFAAANSAFREYWATSEPDSPPSPAEPDTTIDVDPIEQIDAGIRRIKASVGDELLQRLHNRHPTFFEDAVVKVLLAMGYGGAEQRGKRVGGSGDGGIDGVIDQDALGLSRVYVQAKRYAIDSTVQRPDIQKFVGALHGQQANQGVFFTTASFSAGAREYADDVSTRVVLIDGDRLVSLMITYGVGVQVKQTHDVVEVDEDFFE